MSILPISFNKSNDLFVLLLKKKGVWCLSSFQDWENETFGAWFNDNDLKKMIKSKKLIKKYYNQNITVLLFDMNIQTVNSINNIIKFLESKYGITTDIEEYQWINIFDAQLPLENLKTDIIDIINLVYKQYTVPSLRVMAKLAKCKISKLKNKEDIIQVLVERFKEKMDVLVERFKEKMILVKNDN